MFASSFEFAVSLHNYYSPEFVSQSNIGYTKGRSQIVRSVNFAVNERMVRPNLGEGRK